MTETATVNKMTNDSDSDWHQIDQLLRMTGNEMANCKDKGWQRTDQWLKTDTHDVLINDKWQMTNV